MSELLSIHPQESFPLEDLSATNADAFSLLLLHKETLHNTHAVAAENDLLYKIGHVMLNHTAEDQLLEFESQALSHGVAVYEAISHYVNPSLAMTNKSLLKPTHDYLTETHIRIRPHLLRAITSLSDALCEKFPNLSQVVESSAQRFHGGAIKAAVAGAALAQKLDEGALLRSLKTLEEPGQ